MQKGIHVTKLIFLVLLPFSCNSQSFISAVEKKLISEEGVRLNSQYGVVDWVKYDFRGFLEDDSCLDGLTQVPLKLTPSSIEYIVEQVEGKTVSMGNWDNKFIKRVNHNKETENAYYLTLPLIIESLNIGFIGLVHGRVHNLYMYFKELRRIGYMSVK